MDEGVDPALLRAWATGRSLARALPAPVPDHGGWRVDTRSETEIARWIYAAPQDGIRTVTALHSTPGYVVKCCCNPESLAGYVADGWSVSATGWFMSGTDMPRPEPLADGYEARLATHAGCFEIEITAADGVSAARGYAGAAPGGFVYDRIATHPEHRRRGLGRALMARLAAEKRDAAVPDLLVATELGKCLYESLGWRALSSYSTACSPGTAS